MPPVRSAAPLLVIVLVLAFAAVLPPPARAEEKADAESALRTELEGVYNRWREAVIGRDAATWEKVTAAYTRMNIRNTIVSQKLDFPDALFDSPVRPPSLVGLKFLDARAVKRTAQAVYFGKIDFGVEAAVESGSPPVAIPENLLVLRFIHEDTWKFDTTRQLSLEGADDVKAQIARDDYAFLEDEAFTPPGEVPPLAKACAKPERIGHLHVVSIGYETAVTINRGPEHLIADTASGELIIGGLKTGPNRIVIRVRPLPAMAGEEEVEKQVRIRVLSLDDRAEKEPVEVFRYDPTTTPKGYEAHFRGLPN